MTGEVREVVEQARALQAQRVIAVFLELGAADSELLGIALRSWVAFAAAALVESPLETAGVSRSSRPRGRRS